MGVSQTKGYYFNAGLLMQRSFEVSPRCMLSVLPNTPLIK